MYKKIYKNMNLMSLFTLILTSILILSACYTSFNNRLKEEIQRETHLLANIVNTQDDTLTLLNNIDEDTTNKRITLISDTGTVLFDNSSSIEDLDNHSNRPEVIAAKENGYGESERYSSTLTSTVYYYAIQLDNHNILRIASETHNVLKIFIDILFPILFIIALIYILTMLLAANLTENITKPLNTIDFIHSQDNNIYPELKPLIDKLTTQNSEIKHQIKKVKLQKLRLQTISENMSEGLIVLDKNCNILSVNKSILNIFGTTENEILNKSFVPLSTSFGFAECLEHALNGEKSVTVLSISKKDYQVFCNPVFEKKKISGLIMLLFDISEKNKTEEIRREFSANVSHELKTPLTTILGYSQIINNGLAKSEDIKGFTKKIEKEASRMIILIEDIIKLSRLDENTESAEHSDIHLLEIAENVIDELKSKAESKNINLELTGKDTIIFGDFSQIAELVYNLCDNAIKYNKDNGSVSLKLSEHTLTVSDTGIGIPEEYLDRIFERFFRVDKSRSKIVNGTGLGLSIVKHIAECNNSHIDVSSKLGEGTTFTVTFNFTQI